ncbi:MAG: flagellar protein FlaG [Desulfobulbaceae bacterium]|nr:flagellar protein FlaG [Desulfobulbaceae bacterium]MCK5341235.1 flagellar protein FlaG [Desulfobulbaceae bacterium]MCK5403676.1 flagellar protein FlaG [Desulfobulbaceae bacterium]
MPVYEIKNPAPLPGEPASFPRKIEPVNGSLPVARIRHIKRKWERKKGGKHKESENKRKMPKAEQAVRMLIESANQDLEQHGVKIHLTLHQQGEEYVLDIFDCSNNIVCNVIGDIVMPLEGLPTLIRKLQEEAGILIDTIS